LVLLASVGCNQASGTPYEVAVSDFVDSWEFGAELCAGQAACGTPAWGVCRAGDLPEETLIRGVHHARLDIHSIFRCEQSAGFLGVCVAPLDCAGLAHADETCAAEQERFAIDCAGFLTALDFLVPGGIGGGLATGGVSGVGGSADGGSGGAVRPSGGASSGGQAAGGAPAAGGSGGQPSTGGSGAGGRHGELASALCDHTEDCDLERWSPEKRAVCAAETVALFGPAIPDPSGTARCIASASCAELGSDLAALVVGCVDLASTYCLDTGTLRACSSAGRCSDSSCRDICQEEAALTLGCGPATPASMDECLCGP